MVVFVVTFEAHAAIATFLQHWAALRERTGVLFYEDLALVDELPPATYAFTDLERLGADELAVARELADQLDAAGLRVLNHPRRALRRYELLCALHEHGVNPFRAYRVFETRLPERYPVFLRCEDDHEGPRSPLLHTPRQVDRALLRARLRGLDLDRLLLVEFCDTRDADGRFVKYGSLVMDGAIVPEHVAVGEDWMLKWSQDQPIEAAEAQEAWRLENPHAEELLRLAAIAGIEYGRFDYAVAPGGIRVWELNTNPYILHHPLSYVDEPERRMELRRAMAVRIIREVERMADAQPAGPAVRIERLPAVRNPRARRRRRGRRARGRSR
jgi:hypothetical protein